MEIRNFKNSWNKYKEVHFVFEILEYVPDVKELILREQYWIDYFKSFHAGFNLAPVSGTTLGMKREFSLEHRAKLAKYQRGRKLSDEIKLKISMAKKGEKRTLEQKRKMSETAKKFNVIENIKGYKTKL